jgi:hypothetical protein
MSEKNKSREFKFSRKGYALLAAIIAVNIFAILMLKAGNMWEREQQRDLEAELLFRAKQYVIAIELYRKKNPNMFPTSLELLYEKKFLRQLYKDPMTEEGKWNIVMRPGRPGAGARSGRGARGIGGGGDRSTGDRGTGVSSGNKGNKGDRGGKDGRGGSEGAGALWIVPEDMLEEYLSQAMIVGVCSTSTEEGYLVYRKKKKYCEWAVYLGQQLEKDMPDLKFVAEGDKNKAPEASRDETETDESGRRIDERGESGDRRDSGTGRGKGERE